MSLPLCRATGLLLAAACTRAPIPTPVRAEPAPAPAHVARASASPATRMTPPTGHAQVRPRPPACLPAAPFAAPSTLADESRLAREHGDDARALACAEEALRLAPRLVAALGARGSALGALGRIEEARLAFARALAVDPDQPEVLLGAAELHVRRMSGGARDALEIGLEYAVRGARAALRPPRKDRDLAARLELLAGMAENDLGRSQLALNRLERVLEVRPQDPDAVYERGVALFELCRFDDAQRAFERALALSPEDPWALHQLGLLAERRGDAGRAAGLLTRARTLAPADFHADLTVDEQTFRGEVERAIAALPPGEREALQLAPVEIRDLPEIEDLRAVDPPLSPAILGLFRGPSETEPCTADDGPRCRSIVFYRKNLLRFARDREELAEQVRVTLLHELGHLHGETEDELRDRGLE
jgi:Flp pilus assembly protein TadD/predicted Zn-dependent protease with MMP-like domain